jgi:hypothetical protein
MLTEPKGKQVRHAVARPGSAKRLSISVVAAQIKFYRQHDAVSAIRGRCEFECVEVDLHYGWLGQQSNSQG